MQCQSCGTQYPDNFRTCPNCGAPASIPNQRPYNGQPNPYNGQPQFNNAQQNPYNGQPQPNNGQQYPYGNPYAAPNQVPQGMSKHDFYHSPICKKYRGNIIASSVLIYV
ncbi:MAG: zinc-ribbon domain-containing protein [Lachnospiraceae bacterium]|nr:zinc-ribbon domain-containing protein [Lachnospiraceae bacterium]